MLHNKFLPGRFLRGHFRGGPFAGRSRKLVLIIGQSNAQGDGLVSELTSANNAAYSPAYPNVLYAAKMDGNTDPPAWTEYTRQSLAPLTYAGSLKHGFELSMMRDLDSALPAGWSCAKFTGAGTNLANQWGPNASYPTLDGTGKNLFTQCVEWTRLKMDELDADLAAVVWEQGENDAGNSTIANAYGTNLAAFYAALKTQFGSVPFIYGRLNSDYANAAGGIGAFTSTIQAAQDTFASTPGVYEINQDSYPLRASDHTHYDGNTLVPLGHVFAGKVANALNVLIPPQASFTSSATNLAVTFTDTSIAPGSSVSAWAWDFGDGATSTAQNPSHTYSGSGTYTVTLTVTAANGKTSAVYSAAVSVSGVAWSVDTASTYAFPASSAEWTAFISGKSLTNWSNPNSLNLGQDATTPLADSIGSISLPLVGAGALYQQAITGFTRKAATLTDGTSGGFKSTSTSLPDISATSSLLLAWIYFPTTAPAANRFVMILGTNASIQWTTAKKIVGGSGSNSTTGTAAYSGVVEPCVIKVNHTGAVTAIYTSQEKIIPTNGAVTGKQVNLGSNGAAASVGYLYSARWDGAAAERSDADVKALLVAFGKTIPWS